MRIPALSSFILGEQRRKAGKPSSDGLELVRVRIGVLPDHAGESPFGLPPQSSQSGRGLLRQDQETEVPFALPGLGASLRQPAALAESPGRPRPPKTLDPPHLDQQIR